MSARFWSHVDKASSPSGCWLWTLSCGHHGYGQLAVDHRHRQAHRVAWELTHGPIPAGQCVCHRCDTPPCVNPDHLFLGTQADNIRDAVAKGRLVFAKHLRKLTDVQRQAVRATYRRGMTNQLAAEYGVSRGTIQRIAHGKVA